MAGPVRYLSGRQNTLRIGIPGYSEQETSLQVLARVGVGTTNATSDLYVRGGAEVTGVVTATTFVGNLTGDVTGNLTGTALSATTATDTIGGIIDVTNLTVSGVSTLGGGVTITNGLDADNLFVTGLSTFNGNTTFNGDAAFGNNDQVKFGDIFGLAIYHDSTDAYIKEDSGGDLKILGSNVVIKNTADDSTAADFVNGGQVNLYYSNAKKFETTGTGVTVTGLTSTTTLNVTGESTFGANLLINDNELRFDYGSGTPSGSIARVSVVEKDVDIFRLSGFAGDITSESGDYGFNLKYTGSREGNNKTFSVFTDNQTGTQVEALSILQDGKVGIGTSRATAELDVYGECRVQDLTVLANATFAGVSISDALGGSLTVSGLATFSQDVYVGGKIYHLDDPLDDTYIEFTEDRIRLFAGGEQLIDAFEGGQDYVKLGDGGDVDINLNDKLHVNGNTGFVGVNSSIPTRDLDVAGGVRLQGALYDKDNQAGTSGQILVSTGSGVDWQTGAPSNAITGITIQDEGTQKGSIGAVTILNFVGSGVTASASGSISTITVEAVTAAGSNKQVQFNDNGLFEGAAGLNYDSAAQKVAIGTDVFGSRTLTVEGEVGISSDVYANRFFATQTIPSALNELVTKNYLDNFQSAITIQKSVGAATTVDVDGNYDNGASGVGAILWGKVNANLVVDGVNATFDERILIKDQTNLYENGIYVVSRVGTGATSWELQRSPEYDSDDEIAPGDFSFIADGTINGGTGWVHITRGNVAIGVSALEWTQFTAPTQTLAGLGLYNSLVTEVSVGTADTSRIVINADDIDLATVATSKSSLTSGDTSFVTKINVDSYGRVTGVITSNTHTFATDTTKGIAAFDATNLTVNAGIVSVAMTPKLTGLSVSGVSTLGFTTTQNLFATNFESVGVITAHAGIDIDGPLYDSTNQVGTTTSVLTSTETGVAWSLVEEVALQGRQGVQGLQGEQGIQGIQGPQGTQGTQGRQGIQGETGPNGGKGVQGSQGRQGIQGIQGEQGVQGRQGLQGRQGTQGEQGVQGYQGVQGIQGTQGTQGVQGIQGSQGRQGLQGTQGTQGIQGIQGSQGPQGIQGQQGVQGLQGRQGTQGQQGENGKRGGIEYLFSTSTVNSDPTQGFFRFNNATPASITRIYLDNLDDPGTDQTDWYDTWDDSTSTTKGYLTLLSASPTGTTSLIFQVDSVTPLSGYYLVSVAHINGASLPSSGERMIFAFSRTGDLGQQGIQGRQGVQGIQGVQGTQGTQGRQGIQGPQGTTGEQGIQGIQGEQGIQGVQGSQGRQGTQGIQGEQGTQGRQGTKGDQGVQGIQGRQGVQGIQGTTGQQGIQGIMGEQGVQGTQGRQGFQGTTGAQGFQGIQGLSGANGAQGTAGQQGIQGRQGIQGEQGTQGIQGRQGNQGIVGETGNQGTQGRQGIQGQTGEQGIQGQQGRQGTQGEQGVQGRQGIQGRQGVQGVIGSQGTTGSQGTAGSDGAQGFQGLQGRQGISGATGSQGIQGNAGSQGTTGQQGIQGRQGTQGEQGIQGRQGLQGTQGIQGISGTFGTQGIQGIQGTQGSQGIQGNNGSQGTNGQQGIQGRQGIQGVLGSRGAGSWVAIVSTNVTHDPTDSTKFTKTSGGSSWNASVRSEQGYVLGAYASAMAPNTSGQAMFGLNTDPSTDDSFSGIDYAIYMNAGTIQIYESGSSLGSFGSYTTSDQLYVIYDGATIRYYKNSTLLRSVSRSPGNALYLDTSIYTQGFGFDSLVFGPMGQQGTQGTQGTQGRQGIQGTQGTTGQQGIQGRQGTQGLIGPSTAINATNDTSTATLLPVMVTATGSNQTPRAGSKLLANFSANTLTMNGARIGDWSGNSSYKGLYHSSQSSTEYMIISADDETYISATTGSGVRIRNGGNDGTNELRIFSGVSGLTWRGSTVWHAANDGAGSGLDADNLDGYTWDSSGKNVRATDFYADDWFRNYNSGEGLYNQATGIHWYSDASNYWNMSMGGSNGGIKFRSSYASTIRGYVYADTSNTIGFLSSAGGWNLRTFSSGGDAEIYQGGGALKVNYSSGSASYRHTTWWNGSCWGNNGINYLVAGRTAAGGSFRFYTNNTTDIETNTTPNGTFAMEIQSSGRVVTKQPLELDSTLVDIGGSAGTSGQLLSSTGSGVSWVNNTGTNSYYYLAINTDKNDTSDYGNLKLTEVSGSSTFEANDTNSTIRTAPILSDFFALTGALSMEITSTGYLKLTTAV